MGFLETLLSPLSRSLNTKHQIFFSLSQHAELAKFSPTKKFTSSFLQLSFHISIMLQKLVCYIRDNSNLLSTTLQKTSGPNMGA